MIFSGQMQNSFPISQGFLFSTYLKWRISHTLPKKFFDSWVLGFAIFLIFRFSNVNFLTSGGAGISIGYWQEIQNAVSLSRDSEILLSPCMLVGRTLLYYATSQRFSNSRLTSHQSTMNLICWSWIGMILQMMKVVYTSFW